MRLDVLYCINYGNLLSVVEKSNVLYKYDMFSEDDDTSHQIAAYLLVPNGLT